jgi:hypothetical protein
LRVVLHDFTLMEPLHSHVGQQGWSIQDSWQRHHVCPRHH